MCLGNICRSPTAEGVLRAICAREGLSWTIDSCGTGSWHVGSLPDPRTREAAAARGYDLTHRARMLDPLDFQRFDYVLAMDRMNLANIEKLAARIHAGATPVRRLFRTFDTLAEEPFEVPDPYAGGPDGFELVLDQCERAARGLVDALR